MHTSGYSHHYISVVKKKKRKKNNNLFDIYFTAVYICSKSGNIPSYRGTVFHISKSTTFLSLVLLIHLSNYIRVKAESGPFAWLSKLLLFGVQSVLTFQGF